MWARLGIRVLCGAAGLGIRLEGAATRRSCDSSNSRSNWRVCATDCLQLSMSSCDRWMRPSTIASKRRLRFLGTLRTPMFNTQSPKSGDLFNASVFDLRRGNLIFVLQQHRAQSAGMLLLILCLLLEALGTAQIVGGAGRPGHAVRQIGTFFQRPQRFPQGALVGMYLLRQQSSASIGVANAATKSHGPAQLRYLPQHAVALRPREHGRRAWPVGVF